jgi:acyl-CoA synthetase (AMP-forming)/AMP-acid ligase II
MLDAPERNSFDLTSLRLALTGGANVPAELVRRLRDSRLFPVVLTAYGLSEVAGAVSLSRPDDDPETIAETAGRVLADIEVRIVDVHGRELPAGEAGEILVRGRTVMEGYLGEPELTAETIDADGWVHTGDVGVMDGDRYLKITDRMKDMLIVGGFNVASAEIERVLVEHPAVAQAAVVAMPDPRLGEVAAAFVVLRPAATTTPAELAAWSRSKLANYKVPRHIEMIDALPLNASMKVLKTVLRERARALVPAER